MLPQSVTTPPLLPYKQPIAAPTSTAQVRCMQLSCLRTTERSPRLRCTTWMFTWVVTHIPVNTRLTRHRSAPQQAAHFAARAQLTRVHGAPPPAASLFPNTNAWTRACAHSSSQPRKHQHNLLAPTLDVAHTCDTCDMPAVHQSPPHPPHTRTAACTRALSFHTTPSVRFLDTLALRLLTNHHGVTGAVALPAAVCCGASRRKTPLPVALPLTGSRGP